jgi:hypothetical protein
MVAQTITRIKMSFIQLRRLFVCFTLFTSSIYAANTDTAISFLPTDSTHANWVFSGLVTNESGDNYGYFFQIQRDGAEFNTLAALFDAQTKKVIVIDESKAIITDPTAQNWHVGQAFLRFNPINDSWIFGLKTHDKKGFNFKVDMLKAPQDNPTVQNLRPGVELLVSQTSRLNGHIQIGDDSKDQFVTAKNAWFRQISLTEQPSKSHPFTGVLCRFNDGSGFYSVNMVEPDTLRGAVAGWRDGQGLSAMMSQFINITQAPEGPWHIRLASPSLHLILSDFIKQDPVVAAGFVADAATPGFCMLSKGSIGVS